MTIDLISRHKPKVRIGQNPKKLTFEINDFNNIFSKYKLYNNNFTFPEIEIEVSGRPIPKRVRMVTLKVESRKKAKFEAVPLEFYETT